MKKAKTLDCIQMKWDIQQQLRKEETGLSLDERKALMRKKILLDPVLGPWLQKTAVKQSDRAPVACVAESRAIYESGKGHSD